MKIGYADPPYYGCGKLYTEQHPDAFDWDDSLTHMRLLDRLQAEFDGWVLHLSATPASIAVYAPLIAGTGARWCSWVKQFAAFKRNIPVAYAWEPVIIKPARKPVVSKRLVMRDWIMCPITMKKGLTGAKPEAVCHWAFELAAACPDDELDDLFPGTGAVSKAWATWRGKFTLPRDGSEPTTEPSNDAPRRPRAMARRPNSEFDSRDGGQLLTGGQGGTAA